MEEKLQETTNQLPRNHCHLCYRQSSRVHTKEHHHSSTEDQTKQIPERVYQRYLTTECCTYTTWGHARCKDILHSWTQSQPSMLSPMEAYYESYTSTECKDQIHSREQTPLWNGKDVCHHHFRSDMGYDKEASWVLKNTRCITMIFLTGSNFQVMEQELGTYSVVLLPVQMMLLWLHTQS